MSKSIEDRFWSKVDRRSPDECWLWLGADDGRGYGRLIGPHREPLRATRVSLALAGVAVPAYLDVLHRCDNPPCVNPAHLYPGTASDNVRDAVRKGRWPSIERDRPEVAAAIRRLARAGLGQRAIARRLGVNRQAVAAISGYGFTTRITRDDRPAVTL